MFDDNTEAADLDAIIFATGYKIGFPCLEEGLVPVERNQVPLYKYVFPDSHKHHTMAILGCLQPIGAIMPLSELQARWACKVFSGTKCLPGLDEMKAETERKRKAMSKRYYQTDRHTIQVLEFNLFACIVMFRFLLISVPEHWTNDKPFQDGLVLQLLSSSRGRGWGGG